MWRHTILLKTIKNDINQRYKILDMSFSFSIYHLMRLLWYDFFERVSEKINKFHLYLFSQRRHQLLFKNVIFLKNWYCSLQVLLSMINFLAFFITWKSHCGKEITKFNIRSLFIAKAFVCKIKLSKVNLDISRIFEPNNKKKKCKMLFSVSAVKHGNWDF